MRKPALISGFVIVVSAASLILARMNNGGSEPSTKRGTAWSISSACTACMNTECAAPAQSGNSSPYAACNGEAQCYRAFAAFADCYRSSGSLMACEREVQAVKKSGSSGTEVLSCFLLDCFSSACEVETRTARAP